MKIQNNKKGVLYMHLVEVRQTLHDTSTERDIYDISKMSRKLVEFAILYEIKD